MPRRALRRIQIIIIDMDSHVDVNRPKLHLDLAPEIELVFVQLVHGLNLRRDREQFEGGSCRHDRDLNSPKQVWRMTGAKGR